jgi:hypothetical protein
MSGDQAARDIVDNSRKSVAKLLAELKRDQAELIAAKRLPNSFDLPEGLAAIERAIAAAEKVSHGLE